MKNIIIFGGTIEGRQLTEALVGSQVQLYICVATDYAASLLPENDNVKVVVGRLNQEEMEGLFQEIQPDICLDSTHPYAVEVTKNIYKACQNMELPYIRIARENTACMKSKEQMKDNQTTGNGVWFVESVEQAAQMLSGTTGNIFITTGSKELEKYCVIPDYKERCVVRVLCTPAVVNKCYELGYAGNHMIAMQGPFGREMNELMLKESQAKWLVTKCSGTVGGYMEKCEAAVSLGVNLVIIGRPLEKVTQEKSLAETLTFLKEYYQIPLKKPVIYLVAMGPGNQALLTQEAKCVLQNADVLIGAKRILDIWKEEKPHFISYRKDEIIHYIKENPQYHYIAICYSGDIGFYSGAKGMAEELTDYEIHIVSGVSSVTYFLNKIHIPWDSVYLASCHGKELNLVDLFEKYNRICVLLGGESSFAVLCSQLENAGYQDVQITIGSNLSYPEEKIIKGSIEEMKHQKTDTLAIAYFER